MGGARSEKGTTESPYTMSDYGPMLTVLPDGEYDAYVTQLASLPPRKQAKWKKTLHHRTGSSVLRHKHGTLVDCTPHGEQVVKPLREYNIGSKNGVVPSHEAAQWINQWLGENAPGS